MQFNAGLLPGGIPNPYGNSQQGYGPAGMPYFPQPITPLPMYGQGISPFPRPMYPFAPISPVGGAFGTGGMMARQSVQGWNNTLYAGGQAAAGIGARMALGSGGWAAGAAAGAAIGSAVPIIGTGIGAAVGGIVGGFGSDMLLGDYAQRGGERLMDPLVGARMRAIQTQNMSMNFVRQGGDLGPGGVGFGLGASMRATNQLTNMAGSREFQGQTGGRFNRQDVMRIAQLAGEMGMLDQSQTATEVAQNVGKISKALANLMKIAGEPDVKRAMQMMGQMRAAGMSVAEGNVAVQNARTFARMAGMSVGDVVAAGSQGAQFFQERGMTGAAGITAGMGAVGAAGMMQTVLSPAALARAGGREGIQSALMRASANSAAMDPVMMAALTTRNGRLEIDHDKLQMLASGKLNINQAVAQTAQNLGGMDNLQRFLTTERGRLRDEMQRAMSPMQQIMLPMRQAQMVQRQTGMTFEAAFTQVTQDTMSEGERSAVLQGFKDPRYWRGLQQQARQTRIEDRQRVAGRRALEAERADEWDITRSIKRNLGRLGRPIRDWQEERAELEDYEEEVERQGGGNVIRAARKERLGSERIRELAISGLRTGGAGAITAARSAANKLSVAATTRQEQFDKLREFGIKPPGYDYRQGSLTAEDLRKHQMGAFEYWISSSGQNLTKEQSNEIMQQRLDVGRALERSMAVTGQQQQETRKAALTSVPGVSKATLQKVMDRASIAIVQAAQENYSQFGKSKPLSSEQINEAIKQAAADMGIPDKQIPALTQSSAIRQAVLNDTAQFATPEAKKVLNETVQLGGEEASRRNVAYKDLTREEADRQRAALYKSIGLETGGWGGVSTKTVKAVSEIVAQRGTDDKTGDMRRKILTVEALRSRIASLTKEGKTEEAAALVEKVRKLEEGMAGQEGYAATKADVVSKLQDMGESQREQVLTRIGGTAAKWSKGIEDYAKQLGGVGKEDYKLAAGSAITEGRTKMLGSAASVFSAALARTGGDEMAAWKAVAESKEYRTDFKGSTKERELIEAAAGGDTQALNELGIISAAKSSGAAEVAGGAGAAPSDIEEGAEEKAIGEMGEEFADATDKLSDAADKLLDAAKNLSGDRETVTVNTNVGAGSPYLVGP